MTICDKCNQYNWEEIILWRCSNSDCQELYSDTNGDEYEIKCSKEFLKEIKELQKRIKFLEGKADDK